jgi:hypothetical protein
MILIILSTHESFTFGTFGYSVERTGKVVFTALSTNPEMLA